MLKNKEEKEPIEEIVEEPKPVGKTSKEILAKKAQAKAKRRAKINEALKGQHNRHK